MRINQSIPLPKIEPIEADYKSQSAFISSVDNIYLESMVKDFFIDNQNRSSQDAINLDIELTNMANKIQKDNWQIEKKYSINCQLIEVLKTLKNGIYKMEVVKNG
jgi:hypothetical protein